jgi:ABC-type transport system involved in multi-copper enzyme maturation permease subunit
MPRQAEAVMKPQATGPATTAVGRTWLGLGLWLLAAAAFGVWCVRTGNFGPAHLAVGAALILAFALLARNGLVRVVGPVLVYDVLRSARRGRFILVRWLYAVGLLLLLLWVYAVWSSERVFRTQAVQNDFREMAKLAEYYFGAFSIAQFLAVALLTPAYVAGAIAEEKEKKTLEFLLATDLENREIVFGKLIARVGNLTLFILTGLPVLSLMQFFGGIDPMLLMASFATTALTAASLAGLSILNSVLRRRARDAIVLTYLAAIGYLAATGATLFLKFTLARYGALVWAGIDWGTVFDAFHAGNPIFGLYAVIQTMNSNGPLYDTILDELKGYAIFHGIVAVGSITWAVLRLRAVALGQAAVIATKPRGIRRTLGRRPPIGRQPMLWKELWIEGKLRFGAVSRVLIALLVGVGFIPVFIILYIVAFERANNLQYSGFFDWLSLAINQIWVRWDEIGRGLNVWLRIMNVVIGVLMLLGIAVRAAGSVGVERDRDTLSSLMTTTVTTSEIMTAKWAGALWSVRGFLWWLGPVWLVALVFGGVNPVVIFLHIPAFLAPATCFASIGLLYSASCRTTLRATAWTIATALLIGGGHWLCMGMCCYTPLNIMARGSGSDFEWIMVSELAMTPPFIFGWDVPRELSDLTLHGRGASQHMTEFAVVGMVAWAIAARAFWSAARARFERLTHRAIWERPIAPPVARARGPRGPIPSGQRAPDG